MSAGLTFFRQPFLLSSFISTQLRYSVAPFFNSARLDRTLFKARERSSKQKLSLGKLLSKSSISSGKGWKPKVLQSKAVSWEVARIRSGPVMESNAFLNSSSVNKAAPSVESWLLWKMLSGPKLVTPKNEPMFWKRESNS